jgi:flagellin-like protein
MKSINSQNKAVSPVIGVILMVAITVILAAVIGTFVLGLGSGQSTNPTAGVNVDKTTSPYDVTLVSLGNGADKIECRGSNGSSDGNSVNTVGQTVDCDSGNSIVAIDNDQNTESVVQTLD